MSEEDLVCLSVVSPCVDELRDRHGHEMTWGLLGGTVGLMLLVHILMVDLPKIQFVRR